MTKLYSADIVINATAYIMAESAEEAVEKLSSIHDDGIEFSSRRQTISDGIEMTGERYGPDMPEISLSPAMTIRAPYRTVSLVEDFDEGDA